MKNIFKTVVIAIGLIVMTGCSISGPILVTDNPNEKKGEASYTVILGIFRPKNVDISIKKAAANGDITKISTVDFRVKSKIFKKTYTTVVTGS
jgi:hypothetical protein